MENLNYFRKRKEGFSEIEKLKKETIKQFVAKHNIESNFKKENKNNELVDINIENINFIDLNCFSSTQQKEMIFLLEN